MLRGGSAPTSDIFASVVESSGSADIRCLAVSGRYRRLRGVADARITDGQKSRSSCGMSGAAGSGRRPVEGGEEGRLGVSSGCGALRRRSRVVLEVEQGELPALRGVMRRDLLA